MAEAHKKIFLVSAVIAKGSANELETQILIAQELGYLPKQETSDVLEKIHSIIRQLIAFQKTLK